MTFLLRRIEDAMLGMAVLLPLAAIALVALARWRIGRGQPSRQAWLRSLAEVGMAAGTVPWLVMGLWPIELPPGAVRWHLVPLSDIGAQLVGPPAEAAAQLVGNLLVFFALGLFAPVRFGAVVGVGRLLALGAASSLALEVAQQLFGTGRVFSVDDVLLNALGCLLGGLVTRRWWMGATKPSAEPDQCGSSFTS